MSSISRLLVFMACLLLVVLPVTAQANDPVNLDDTATVIVPEGWDFSTAAAFDSDTFGELEGSVLSIDDLIVLVLTPTQVDAFLGDDASTDPAERFIAIYAALYDYDVDPDVVKTDTVFGYDSRFWLYTYDDEAGEGEAYLLLTDEAAGNGFYVDVYGPNGSIEPVTDQIDEIFVSLALTGSDAPVVLSSTAELEPGITVGLPDGWEASPAGEYDSYFADIPNLEATIVANEDIWILILTPAQVEALLDGGGTPEDPVSLLIDVYNLLYDEVIAEDQIEEATVGGLDARVWYYFYQLEDEDDTEGEAYVLITDPATGAAFFVDAYGQEGTIEPNADDIDAILASIAANVSPQADSRSTSRPDLAVAVPDGWETQSAGDFDSYFNDIPNLEADILSSDTVSVLVMTPAQIEKLLDGIEIPEDPADLLLTLYDMIYETTVDPDEIETETIFGLDARSWFYTNEDFEGVGYLLVDDSGAVFFVEPYGLPDDLTAASDDIDTILESIAALSAETSR